MGNMFRKDEEPFFCYLLGVAESSNNMPNIGIDESLIKYSGLNSAAELEDSVTRVLSDVASKSPDFLNSLGGALTAFESVSKAVGLGALVVSIMLEITISVLRKKEKEDNTFDIIRRVFADEKASCVRDSIEEYLKRLGMHLHQPKKALEETERLEKQLSEQLTRLKNSMLHDNQMNSRLLRHWTNGAAFHLQMLIHAARLTVQNTTKDEEQLKVYVDSITSVLDRYQFDLQELLKQYKVYKKSNIFLFQPTSKIMEVIGGYDWVVIDKELNVETPTVLYPNEVLGSSEAFVDYMFDHWILIKNLKSYFSELRDNVQELIVQNVEFNVQKVLPVSG